MSAKNLDLSLDYKVADINLADFGKKEIQLSEREMPGLMELIRRYGDKKPLKGLKISGSLHMTIQTAMLIRTLYELGADIRWASCNIFLHPRTTPPRPLPNLGHGQGVRLEGRNPGRLLVVHRDGPDLARRLRPRPHRGTTAATPPCSFTRAWPPRTNPRAARNDAPASKEEGIIMERVALSLTNDPYRWHRVAAAVRGVSEETTTGVHRLYQMEKEGKLLFPAINVNDSVTKSKFDNLYGCRESLADGIKRATDIMVAGKVVVVCGYGDVGKGCAASMRGFGARVLVTEIDPICALQAAMEGYQVVTMEDALPYGDIYVTCTGNCDVITGEHMMGMKDEAIVCNIGHFDSEIQMSWLESNPDCRKMEIKPQVDKWFLPSGRSIIVLAEGRLVNLGCATGHASFVMSNSFTNQVLAQMDLAANKHEARVYTLPKKLDEEVARLHLARLGAKLSKLTQKQADYIGVPVDGPFKNDMYRY